MDNMSHISHSLVGSNTALPLLCFAEGSHTDNVQENVFFQTRRVSNYELVAFWVVSLLPIPLSDIHHKLEPLCGLKKITFQSVSVCDPLKISVVGGN